MSGSGRRGCRGITIRHGTVRGIHGVGVALRDCHNIAMQGVAARDCGGAGAIDTGFLDRNGGLFVMGTRRNDVTAPSTGIRIIDCVCSGSASDLDRVVTLGALLLFCDNVLVSDSAFHRTWNGSREPSGVQFNVVGLDIVRCANVLVTDCQAHDNRSGGEPAGFFAWGQNIAFERCHAHRNGTTTGSHACGFNISFTRGLVLDACSAFGTGNANPDVPVDGEVGFAAAGFRIGRDVAGAVLRNCTASGTCAATASAPAGGFVLNDATNVLLTGCAAIETSNTNDHAAGFVVEPTGSAIESCRTLGSRRHVWRRQPGPAEASDAAAEDA